MKNLHPNRLYQLYLFYLTATSGPSLTRAAEDLNISIPTASEALSKLRDDYPNDLFVNKTRKIELTDDGQMLLEQISPAMNMVKRFFKNMGEL